MKIRVGSIKRVFLENVNLDFEKNLQHLWFDIYILKPDCFQKLLSLCVPQFTHLWNGVYNSSVTYLRGLLQGMKEMT